MGAQKRKSIAGQDPNAPQLLGGTAIKPPERHGMDIIKYLIHDPDKGEYFTRTPKSWALIFIFYVIYYTCLAAFWYGMLNIFFIFLPDNQPKYIMEESIIGVNPGVGMIPKQPDKSIDSSMIYLRTQYKGNEDPTIQSKDVESASNKGWMLRYKSFLSTYDYNDTVQTEIGRQCAGSEPSNFGEKACIFDTADLGPCAQEPYGYLTDNGEPFVTPCVILKLNRIYGWIPQAYEDADLEKKDDPEQVLPPEDVLGHLQNDRNKIYLHCEGRNPADRDALNNGAELEYFPSDAGIPFTYFPYNHAHQFYSTPLVAVRFKNPPTGQLLHIECKSWFKGVVHNTKDRVGQVHFELYVDDDAKFEYERE